LHFARQATAAVKMPLMPGLENSALFGAGDPETKGLTPGLKR